MWDDENIDTADSDKLVRLSNSIWIIQPSKQSVCLVTKEIVESGDVVVGIQRDDDQFEVISIDGVTEMVDTLQFKNLESITTSTSYLQTVENIALASCDAGCALCGGKIEENEEVLLLNDMYGGYIDPWIHFGDCVNTLTDKLEEINLTDISEHNPEIVTRNI